MKCVELIKVKIARARREASSLNILNLLSTVTRDLLPKP